MCVAINLADPVCSSTIVVGRVNKVEKYQVSVMKVMKCVNSKPVLAKVVSTLFISTAKAGDKNIYSAC